MIPQLSYKIYQTTVTFWSWWSEAGNQHDHLARAILTVSVPTLLLLWWKWVFSPLPPGPYGLPVVGYLPFLTSNLHQQFTQMANRYGPIFSLRLGTKLHVVVNSTDLVKSIARDLDQTFANRNPPLTALTITYGGMDIAWSNSNAHWRTMRKLLVSQVMSSSNLKACRSFRTHEVRRTVKAVYGKIGTKVDVNEIAFVTEVNVVTSMLWGCSKSVEGTDSSYIGDGFREVEFKIIELIGLVNISDFIPAVSWFDLQGRQREMKKQLEYVDRIFDEIIQGRIRANSVEKDGRKDFVQMLLELKDQKDNPTSLDMIKIKAILMVIN